MWQWPITYQLVPNKNKSIDALCLLARPVSQSTIWHIRWKLFIVTFNAIRPYCVYFVRKSDKQFRAIRWFIFPSIYSTHCVFRRGLLCIDDHVYVRIQWLLFAHEILPKKSDNTINSTSRGWCLFVKFIVKSPDMSCIDTWRVGKYKYLATKCVHVRQFNGEPMAKRTSRWRLKVFPF